jgi:cell division protein FtsQ
MKRHSGVIFLMVMFLLVGSSYWFSQLKNRARTLDKFSVEFTHPALLLDTLLVNKLLTQNFKIQSNEDKESLDLNMLETQLKRTQEVQNVEIYQLPQGGLSVAVTERKPLFELESHTRFLGDVEGVLFKYQPIGLRLPILKMDSINATISSSADLISKLKQDPLLDFELETISLDEIGYTLELRSFPFQVILGDSTQLKHKLEKLRIFCAFQISQDSLKGYDRINLSYDNQVVATTL